MRAFIASLLIWTVCAQVGRAEPPPSPSQNQDPPSQAGKRSDQPLLRSVLQSQFNEEQLAQFKQAPTLEELVGRMSKEQRDGARARLGDLESPAKTPADLEQIANGYLMLDEREPSRGRNAVRVAARLQELDPKSSAGCTLAANGFYQMKDYEAAAKASLDALRRNPQDQAAVAVYKLSVGRGGPPKDFDAKAIANIFPVRSPEEIGDSQGLPSGRRDDSDLPMKLPVHARQKPLTVPSLTKTGSESTPGGSPLLPLGSAGLVLGLAAYGVSRARKPGETEDDVSSEGVQKPGFFSDPVGAVSDYAFRAKIFVEDHPYMSLGVGVGAVVLSAGLAGPTLLAGGGELFLGGGGAAALAPAAAVTVAAPAAGVTAGPAVAAGTLILMAGDDKGGETKEEASESKPDARDRRVANPWKSESSVWKKFENYRNGIKRSGTGSRTRYYKWDNLHNDIEMYDAKGRHLGSLDPRTGLRYKAPALGRTIASEL